MRIAKDHVADKFPLRLCEHVVVATDRGWCLQLKCLAKVIQLLVHLCCKLKEKLVMQSLLETRGVNDAPSDFKSERVVEEQ